MSLHFYFVNRCERRWSEWLQVVEASPTPTTTDFMDSDYYPADGSYLALIHLGRAVTAEDLVAHESAWKRLPDPERVFWLFYGGVAHRERATVTNIHYLRYPIADSRELHDDVIARFKELLRAVTGPTTERVWDVLYPPDNVRLATLLALLQAADYVDVDAAVQRVVHNPAEIRAAHDEYARRLPINQEPLAFDAWVSDLESRSYQRIRSEINRVLGAVPD